MSKISAYWRLMRFDRPIGILLLLWPTLWALWIGARGMPSPLILTVFIVGVVLMRAAGCVINDVADRKFDGNVDRTKNRPLATGELRVGSALVLFIILCVVAFFLVLFLNRLSIKLAFIALALAVVYPFMKRYLSVPQLVLGLAFSWGIPMAFAAVLNHIPPIAWILFAVSVLWALVYDTEYAMVDRPDDLKLGIKSTAVLFGRWERFFIGLFQLSILLLWCWLALILNYGMGFYLFMMVCALLMGYQQVLIFNADRQRCFQAFLNNHWIGLLFFCGIITQLY